MGRDIQFQHDILVGDGGHRGGGAARRHRDLGTLFDNGFGLVSCDHTRVGNNFNSAFFLCGGQFQIQQIIAHFQHSRTDYAAWPSQSGHAHVRQGIATGKKTTFRD